MRIMSLLHLFWWFCFEIIGHYLGQSECLSSLEQLDHNNLWFWNKAMKINGTQSFSANYNTQQNSFKPSLQNFRVTSSTENCCHQSSPIIMKFHCNPRTLRTPHKWLSKYGFVIIMVPLKRRQPDLSYDMQLLAQFYHSSQINISLGLHYIDTPCMTQYGHSAWHTLNVSTRTHFGYISVFNNQNKHIFLKRYITNHVLVHTQQNSYKHLQWTTLKCLISVLVIKSTHLI